METVFERRLKEKIGLMRDMVIQSMADTGYSSFDEYRYNLGYLQALRRVVEEIEEVQDELRKS
jgi:hypothetical protein